MRRKQANGEKMDPDYKCPFALRADHKRWNCKRTAFEVRKVAFIVSIYLETTFKLQS